MESYIHEKESTYFLLSFVTIWYILLTTLELIKQINIYCSKQADLDQFADHVFNFDNVCRLDSMMLKLLGRAKFDLEEEVFLKEEEQRLHEEEIEEERREESESLKDTYHKGNV